MAGKEQFTFQSVQHQPLSARKWFPEGPFRGIVQLVHGMAEHIDRYDGVAEALNARGFLVVGHNQLGHGAGTPLRGYFGEKDGWQSLIDGASQDGVHLYEKYSVMMLDYLKSHYITVDAPAEEATEVQA